MSGSRSSSSRSTALAAAGSDGGDNERMKKILRIRKLKESGGNYEALLNNADGKSALLEGYEDSKDDGPLGMADYTQEDREMYEEIRRQDKQALVDKILKAKEKFEQRSGANKGQPSPYLARKVTNILYVHYYTLSSSKLLTYILAVDH